MTSDCHLCPVLLSGIGQWTQLKSASFSLSFHCVIEMILLLYCDRGLLYETIWMWATLKWNLIVDVTAAVTVSISFTRRYVVGFQIQIGPLVSYATRDTQRDLWTSINCIDGNGPKIIEIRNNAVHRSVTMQFRHNTRQLHYWRTNEMNTADMHSMAVSGMTVICKHQIGHNSVRRVERPGPDTTRCTRAMVLAPFGVCRIDRVF